MGKSRTDAIISKIKNDRINIRSKLSVITEKLGFDSLVVLIFGALTVLGGVMLVWLIYSRDLLTDYGSYGWISFIQSFPFIQAVVFFTVFLLLILTIRRFDFSYKKPLVLVIGVLFICVLAIAWILSFNPNTKDMFIRGGKMLRLTNQSSANYLLGTVEATGSGELYLNTDEGEKVAVKIGDETHYPFGIPKSGDYVRTVGSWKDGRFEAVGVRVFGDDETGSGYGQGRGKSIEGRGGQRKFRNRLQ